MLFCSVLSFQTDPPRLQNRSQEPPKMLLQLAGSCFRTASGMVLGPKVTLYWLFSVLLLLCSIASASLSPYVFGAVLPPTLVLGFSSWRCPQKGAHAESTGPASTFPCFSRSALPPAPREGSKTTQENIANISTQQA